MKNYISAICKKVMLGSLALLLVHGMPAAVMAQEQSEESNHEQEKNQAQSSATEQAAGESEETSNDDSAENNATAPGGFVPSEEISEDLPVSFPVDI